jgi:methoxymalonate biosynthesis acyl carrier protein
VTDKTELEAQIAAFFSEKLNMNVTSADTDLVQTRILDSLGVVDLLLYLEQEFGIDASLDNLEIDDLRSIAKIAELVLERRYSS